MQNYVYPSSSDVTLTGTPNNAPIPSTSLLVAGENPSGNQEPLQTDNSGNLNVNVISSALPAGASTSANQTLEITQLTGIHSDTTSIDSKTVHVDTGNVTVVASALPAGASTSALQTSGNTILSAIQTSSASIDSKTPALGQALAAGSTPVVLTASQLTTLTPLTSVTVTQATGTNLHTVVDSSALPAGASTSALQTTISAQIPTTLGQKTSANSLATVIASDQSPIPVSGTVAISQTTPGVTNGVQVIAAIPAGTNSIGTVKSQASTPTPLTITQGAITVGTTAVRLTVSGSTPSATRVVLVATPDSSSTAKFYIGSSTVTSTGSTRGIQIAAGQVFIANNDAADYWIVSSAVLQAVEVMEQA